MKHNWILKTLLVLMALNVSWMAFIFIDHFYNNDTLYANMRYPKKCDYVVPSGYKIVYSDSIKRYAIAVLSYKDYYLYIQTIGIEPMFSSIAGPTYFYDSCTAKGMLEKYIYDISPKALYFK